MGFSGASGDGEWRAWGREGTMKEVLQLEHAERGMLAGRM